MSTADDARKNLAEAVRAVYRLPRQSDREGILKAAMIDIAGLLGYELKGM